MGSDLAMESMYATKANKQSEDSVRNCKLIRKDVLDCNPIWSFDYGYERRVYLTPTGEEWVTYWERRLGIPCIIDSVSTKTVAIKYFNYLIDNNIPAGGVDLTHFGVHSKYGGDNGELPIWEPGTSL